MSKGKTFGCLKCGHPFEAFPPDDFHREASLNKENIDDPIEMKYKCRYTSCGHETTLFWGQRKISVGVG